MTRIWLPLQLVLPITGGKWQKVLSKVSVLLCVAFSASNVFAQTSVCPPPWSNAKFVYGEIMLKGKASTTANGQTQTINEEGTAQAAIPLNASCIWAIANGGGPGPVTRAVSLNDAVTYPPDPVNNCTSQTVTDTWVGNNTSLTAGVRLEFVTSDTYMFAFGFGEGFNETTCDGGCDPFTIQNLGPIGPPFDPSDALIHSPIFPVSGSELLTGTWTFSAVPQLLLLDSFVTSQPLQWTVTWAFSPVPDDTVAESCKSKGASELGCQNQSLGEDIPISGTAFSLHYQSDRQLGRAGADPVAISDAQGLGGWTLSVHHALNSQVITQFCIDGSCTPWGLQPKALFLGDGQMRSAAQEFTNIEPCGAKATHSETQAISQMSESVSLPDSSSFSTTVGPDPRWGIQVPVNTKTTLTFGGLTMNSTSARNVVLVTPNNPFSLTRLTDVTAVNGRSYTSEYTSSNRAYKNTSPDGRQSTVQLDVNERIASSQFGDLLATNLAYDSRGRLASVTEGTRREVLTYDTNGYLASITDPLGLKTTFTHDIVGKRLTTTLPDGRILHYAYDANSNLTSITPPGKSAHAFAFTAVNLPLSYTPPAISGTGATRYLYDADRRLSMVIRPDGETVKYSYDHAGRLSSMVMPTATLNYGYSATTCNLVSAGISGGEELTYGYDGPLLTTTSWTGMVAGKLSKVYNNNFWIVSESIGGGTTVAFTYDNDGLLTKAGALTLNRSTTNGLITGTTLGSASDARTYNPFGEITGYIASYKGTPVYNVALVRDNLGRITQMSESIGGKTNTYGYNYDSSGRLISVLQNGHSASSYTYDSNSNRLTGTAGTVTEKGTYDAQDRLLGYGSALYTYTPNGELASKSIGGMKATYQYDALGNLLVVTLANGKKISYVIDPQSRRVGKKVNGTLAAGFIYDDDRLVAQLNASNAIVSQFIYASSDSVPDYMLTGGVIYRIFSDHLGSPRLIVNASTGQIAERIDYDEFGNVTTDTNPGFQPFGFAGGLYDQDTKLVRFGARDYDASIGRWTAKDPILFSGSDSNLYGYALNDPVNLTDPNGLDNVPDVFGESLPSKAQRAQPPKKGVQEYKEVEKEAEKTSQSALEYFKSLKDIFKKTFCGDDKTPPPPPPPPQPKPKAPPKLPEFKWKPAT